MSIIDSLKNLANKTLDVAKVAAEDAKNLAGDVVETTKQTYEESGVKGVINKASGELTQAGTQLTGIATKAVDGTKAALNEQGGVQGLLDKATAELNEVKQKAMNTANEVAQTAVNTTKAKVDGLKDVASDVLDKAKGKNSTAG